MALLEVSPLSLSYLVIGAFLILFVLVSAVYKDKLFIDETILGTLFGIILGPYGANAFNPRSFGGGDKEASDNITLEFMRIILVIGLFTMGLELPKSYLMKHARSLIVMVVPSMVFAWVVCAGLLKLIFPHLDFVSSFLISACLTHTDPTLITAMTRGDFAEKYIFEHTRLILKAESAANSGLAYLFLSLAVFLTVENSTKTAMEKWFLIGWLYQVILAVVLGTVIGRLANYLMRWGQGKGVLDHKSFGVQLAAVAIFTAGVITSLGVDILLAAFATGVALAWGDHFAEQIHNATFTNVVDCLLKSVGFIYIGAWINFSDFDMPDLGISPARLLSLFLAILALRRVPAIVILYNWIPDIHTWHEALFCGHFGPMGVGALFIASYAKRQLPRVEGIAQTQAEMLHESLQPIVSFLVLGSILVHGLSIPMYWCGKRLFMKKALGQDLEQGISSTDPKLGPMQPIPIPKKLHIKIPVSFPVIAEIEADTPKVKDDARFPVKSAFSFDTFDHGDTMGRYTENGTMLGVVITDTDGVESLSDEEEERRRYLYGLSRF